MLCFVGLGISGFDSIPQEGIAALKDADVVYLEQFTSPISESQQDKLRTLTKGEFKLGKRWMVEDGKEILQNAKNKSVVLLSYGDPYIATTHIELRTRAISEKIQTRSIHGSSAATSIIGEAGLHYYKLGRIVTIMKNNQTLSTPYYVIYKNLLEGNHTLLLLEYNEDEKFFLDPKNALDDLLKTEEEQKRNVINSSTYAIVASRVGLTNQKIISGKISSLIKTDFGDAPHSIIIPGSFHFTESDALTVLSTCLDKPSDNTYIKKISEQMLQKYIPMVEKALEEIIPYYSDSQEFKGVLENAALYIKDAKKFQERGKDELAVLSIGYAEGLVDALKIAKGLEPYN